ncbi:hypothetical protein LG329_19560 (plasmid) [Virgibacillus necropolis]|uniref:hypothetical protein n=1 Tax=Virgibacillus necropolis TaxID=163877 RepID=UPI00384D50A0
MSTTERKLFSYDREEDADIHKFLNKLPPRQQSKYIRIALRLLKEQLETGNIEQSRNLSHDVSQQKRENINTTTYNEDDDYEDISGDTLDMGK